MSKRPIWLLVAGFILVVLGSQGLAGVVMLVRQWDYFSRRPLPESVFIDMALVLLFGIGVTAALAGARGLRHRDEARVEVEASRRP